MPNRPNTSAPDFLKSLGRIKQTVVSGTFRPNASSAPTAVRGWCASVTYVSTGLYRVNLPENIPNGFDPHVFAQCRFAAKDARQIEVGTVSAGTSTTGAHFFIRSMNVGTSTLSDIAADANNIMSWELKFANTGVTT